VSDYRIADADLEDVTDLDAARALFLEYAGSLGFSLGYQDFESELAALPGKYAPPRGRLLLGRIGVEIAGVVALRPLVSDVCEMKRLYVRPAFRGKHLGEALIDRVVAEAAAIGYRRLRLDTITDRMQSAIALYRARGFVEIPAYYDSPIPGTLYLEKTLG
jgi:putative acetyltransferase